jgi:hypothetical protein
MAVKRLFCTEADMRTMRGENGPGEEVQPTKSHIYAFQASASGVHGSLLSLFEFVETLP